ANDSLAFRAVQVLRADDRRVPQDVAIVGFDDIPLAQEMLPPLTTVRIPLAEIGRRAATRVLRLIDADQSDSAEPDLVPAELIRRAPALAWAYAAATYFRTTIFQPSTTRSRISRRSIASSRTWIQWNRRSDSRGSVNLCGSDSTTIGRQSLGKAMPMVVSWREMARKTICLTRNLRWP